MAVDPNAHVVVISHELVGPRMAGPGIRYHHLARVLAGDLPVMLAAPAGSTPVTGHDLYRLHTYVPHEWPGLAPVLSGARAVIAPSDTVSHFPALAESGVPLVVDGYDPLLAETMFLIGSRALDEQGLIWRQRLGGLRAQYRAGDFFICASERQRDWWLGLLEAHGRINPWTVNGDPGLRRLIDVVPFGVDPDPIDPGPPVMRGAWPGVGPQDQVVLWGGGLWPWLDPLTAIRALGLLADRWPRLRLVFPGTRHPNPERVKDTPTLLGAAQAEVRDLGLRDRVVFSDWVAYGEWSRALAESDVALSLHAEETYESRLAFRSRVLEYIRADLPVVATHGDATADLVATYGLGTLVDAGDVAGVARAIDGWLTRGRGDSAMFAAAREALSWNRAAAPLLRFCRDPRRAADHHMMAGADLEQQAVIESERARRVAAENELGRVNQMLYIRLVRWLAPLRQRLGL